MSAPDYGALTVRTRRAQGLSDQVEDDVILARVAALVAGSVADQDAPTTRVGADQRDDADLEVEAGATTITSTATAPNPHHEIGERGVS